MKKILVYVVAVAVALGTLTFGGPVSAAKAPAKATTPVVKMAQATGTSVAPTTGATKKPTLTEKKAKAKKNKKHKKAKGKKGSKKASKGASTDKNVSVGGSTQVKAGAAK
jgi:hypothetical protein